MFDKDNIKSYIPDGVTLSQALSRTTHLAIAAHPDDIEIIGFHGISRCYQVADQWFTGIVVTDGSGSPRGAPFQAYSDAEMIAARVEEQQQAAKLGEYSAVLQLGFCSDEVKGRINLSLVEYLSVQLALAQPDTLYLHNLADRHDTHIGVCIHALEALRKLPKAIRPESVYGIEVWRNLDWLPEEHRIRLDVSAHTDLFNKLIRVFESQIGGGKRYEQALPGRQSANATFDQSHVVDQSSAITLAMDLSGLVQNEHIAYSDFMEAVFCDFTTDVIQRINRYG